jgi:hypothetical protein
MDMMRFAAGVLSMLPFMATVTAAPEQAAQQGTSLVDVVRESVGGLADPNAATEAGWISSGACVSGPQEGAMGVHFVNGPLVGDGELDARRPEALIFEQRNGRYRLVGVEYIVIAEAWHANHAAPPVLLGQQFHLVGSPNRYGLPAFYELHVWAWRINPNGTFVDWNPRVSCDQFAPGGSLHTGHAD